MYMFIVKLIYLGNLKRLEGNGVWFGPSLVKSCNYLYSLLFDYLSKYSLTYSKTQSVYVWRAEGLII